MVLIDEQLLDETDRQLFSQKKSVRSRFSPKEISIVSVFGLWICSMCGVGRGEGWVGRGGRKEEKNKRFPPPRNTTPGWEEPEADIEREKLNSFFNFYAYIH